ncbi:DNA-directed primase/polymerase protein [Pimephales promelas]|uniref:DNA-directed primase/polymerase protein n=1 Tax=Pimephales promelas TaxID=90988 RepID=UPI00195574DC|nr:DNA-directed primase/polymerase protein [Pimephales promelas]XP_039548887.1 DNA-directed primase/polymerase protein [Pimephales promelas]XP_039548894.1 DNA-directed primase/polymerase protein [Pimephales promelas]XP_039548904.1 DNA-directed primase/polymerase protein [Pimephales promelas]XP_039548911.1 DNA-directed primase/polymerase protein [Pimephales promelas]XP_039548919.1 DNA-directed primase/polymerase protein [Pimephales promelas]KAG1956719.1 DNA-directed primase/polymerase protein 
MMGGKWQDRLKSLEQRASSFQSSPLCSPYKPRLSRPWQPSSVWRLFPRQNAAIAFIQHIKQDVHIFSLEKEGSDAGQRIFLVTSYNELWHYYSTHRQSLMHCYEVILEGAVCKLYFDLEFHKGTNTHLDGKIMVAKLIQYVCEKLEEFYSLHCAAKDVLNLDSSTSEKFSRHLIFMLPSAAFKDNSHVGRFIHDILHPVITNLQKSNPEAPKQTRDDADGSQTKRLKFEEKDLGFLVVKSKNGQEQLFVDLGVYTKNRNFRLYKSSKLGKNAAFSVAEDNKFVPKPSNHTTKEECIFLDSLITNISFTGQRILTYDIPQKNTAGSLCSTLQRQSHSSDLLGEQKPSPFKEVDVFVLTLLCKDGIQGSIRRWNYFASEQLLVYDIEKFRWCHNVKRFHKSNNIIIVVDLKEEVWYQRCHDPDCRRQNFRSSSFPLPPEVCMSHLLMKDEEDQEYLTDELGNIELAMSSVLTNASAESSSAARPENTEDWGEWPDDPAYLEALQEVERTTEEVPDELLLQAVTECE